MPLQSAKNRVHTILQLWLWSPTWRRNRSVLANEYIMKCSSLASISYLLLWLDGQILGVWLRPQAYSKYIRLWSFTFCARHILQVSQHQDRFALVYALERLLKVIRLVSAEWNGSIHCCFTVTKAATASLSSEFNSITDHWSASVYQHMVTYSTDTHNVAHLMVPLHSEKVSSEAWVTSCSELDYFSLHFQAAPT